MVPSPSNDRHCLVSLATKGVAPLLVEEEASHNVPRQMHRNAAAAAEEECVSLSVKGWGVGLGIYRAHGGVSADILAGHHSPSLTQTTPHQTRASDHTVQCLFSADPTLQ